MAWKPAISGFVKILIISAQQFYSTTFSSLIFTSILFSILLYFNVESVSSLIGYKENSDYVLLLGLTIALDAVSAVPFAKLRIENRARLFAIIKFINIGINIALNLFFLLIVPNFFSDNNFFYKYFFDGRDVGYIFLSNFLASLLTILLLLPQVLQAFKPYVVDFKLLKRIFIYSYPLLFAGIAGMMSENLDRILLKYFIVTPDKLIELVHRVVLLPAWLYDSNQYVMHQVGIYGANVKLAVIMTLSIQAYRYAAEPFFFNYSSKTDSKLLYAKVMKYFILFGLSVFLGVTLFIDYAKHFINSSYHEGLYVVPILLISKLFFGIIFNLSIWYKLTNKTHYGALLAFIGAFVSIFLNVLLIPRIGYLGCAWASLAAYVAMTLISFALLRKHFPINYDLKGIFLYFFAAFTFYAVNIYFKESYRILPILNFLFIMSFVFLFIKREQINIKSLAKSLIRR
ncbi:MAG: polysaccharide biosynthesis protein [Chloroflexia bacterium]|nr:polysaccharide biosynthesis protein [Chloroflexia bacterium]